jgi:hypothetical protein
MMGADAPIPPLLIDAAAPAGRSRGGFLFPVFPETELAPPCRKEALRRGVLVKVSHDFHRSGVKSRSRRFPQSKNIVIRDKKTGGV